MLSLRDYEKLPNIGNDLDIVHENKNCESIVKILDEAVTMFSWDELVQIKRWDSYISDFSILVFKLVDYKNTSVLYIDVFFGYSIYSAKGISGRDFVGKESKRKILL